MGEHITVSASVVGNSKIPAAQFTLPGTLAEALPIAARDMEILAGIIKQHPADAVKLIEASQKADRPEMERLCDVIGLREELFVKQGGGLFPIGVVIILVLVLGGAAVHKGR
ncbi:MAG TPA: hypothetical protein VH143_03750 [Kofleriaceae bacterium]|jgi:hypothetical protein|nr:hypothetical protein [Kofleriaceae bacterium]